MRVLLISNMYPSEDDPAYGSFVARQRRRLAEQHDVDFVLVASTARGGGAASVRKYAALAWRTLLATARGRYDLVHAHYLMPTAALALLPAAVHRKPLVLTAHGTDIRSGRRGVWRGLIRRAMRRASKVLVVSEHLRREMVEGYGEPAGDVVVANMGVDTLLFRPGGKAALKEARSLPAEECHFVFVGNLVEQKGVEDLARALALLDERGVAFRATILGGGPLEGLVRSIVEPLGDRVRVEPYAQHAELPALLGSADVFVLPSRREGVGLLVCLEALACGVPVVAARAGGLPEIVHDGVNGLVVPPEDPDALADALASLAEDPGRRSALARMARATALPYDEARQADVVYEAYRECLGLRRVVRAC